MRLFPLTILLFGALCSRAQVTKNGQSKRSYAPSVGKTAYYFWKKEGDGFIDSGNVIQPFCSNKCVVFDQQHQWKLNLSVTEMSSWVEAALTDPEWDKNNRYFWFRLYHRKEWKIIQSLEEIPTSKANSVIFCRFKGEWISTSVESVLYFEVTNEQKWYYRKHSDSIQIPEWNINLPSNGHYQVIRYQRQALPDSVQVLNGSGQDVSGLLRADIPNTPERFLILINGYRGPKTDDDPGDGVLTLKDRYYYWFKIDNRFQEIVQPDVMYYLDGSFPMKTSVHRNRLRFSWSWLRTKLTPKHKAKPRVYRKLNTDENPDGFAVRREAGKVAGEAFLIARNQLPHAPEVKDTVDIVSHSMGYAYSLGFMEVVAPYVYLRNNYIIAPENANEGGFDWSQMAHVWQYGSDLGEQQADPLRQQDGIAPQLPVKGIEQLPPDKGGRIFVPKDWPNKNFVDVHMIYSYDWIFDRIPKGYPGYIGP